MTNDQKDLLKVIKSRRSIRHYKSEPVSEEVLNKVLDAARLAPSAANRQCWRLVVVRDPATKRALRDSARAVFIDANHHIDEAPVVLAACTMPKQSNWHIYDISILSTYILLVAHYYGLGTCWIGLFNEDRVKEILGIPTEHKVAALITLGYPAEDPPPTPRLEAPEITYQERWGAQNKSSVISHKSLVRQGFLTVALKIIKHIWRGLFR